ncbi:tripartite tricarboxylate transporter substrate binding protein [Limnohabitans sp. MMS-10A-178]|jgi:tripartite-type tricarboxylate transporter receptor subunit TctC|uniref:Bug family tripartite tricarboxylate transporter substrate binding protein n=1 Tax=Limnohabitans sp. MMS-10A-178 TaxID=1835767 RepID=UPI000D3571CA|nr:tripartite tricarboxylate transporter substrate binding protein [Limnohabitans sp. MMS-10A-178]PUE14699.1 hypothetical protein B9Z32_09430 [Limnohabitans sp. MMS-10A-178]
MNHIEMRRNLLSIVLVAGAAAACPALAQPLQASDFPSRAITIVVPYPAGGGTDRIARLLAQELGKSLNQTVIVDNKAGGGGVIGTSFVARAQPDGYTLMVTASAHAVNPGLRDDLPYSVKTSFTNVALMADEPGVLLTPLDRPFKSLQDVINAAKRSPGKLSYGSTGIGTTTHLTGELFKSMAQVDILHVPYKGGSPQMADVVGGQIDLAFATTGTAGAMIKGGKVRALAVTTQQRVPTLPDLPTFDEAGVKGYSAALWYGVFGPAGLPPAVVAKLNAAIVKAMHSDAVKKPLEDFGFTVRTQGAAEFDRYVNDEVERWGKIIKANNIKP